MNYIELEQKLGKQNEADWHQASGGGWIYKDSKVDNEANIQDNAIVMSSARVSGNARVFDDAIVFGNALVFGNAWEKSPLYLLDSRNHGATNCRHGWLRIGCE